MSNNEKILADKVVWVTGSSRGIGKGIADHLASLGAAVAIHGTSPSSPKMLNEGESLEASAKALSEAYGGKAIFVHGDLTDEGVVKKCAEQVRTELGPIDILVNCAGGDIGVRGVTAPKAGRPEHNDMIFISVEDVQKVFDRNVMTCILCCREVAPDMMKRKSGKIVNIGSGAGLVGREEGGIYGTAKAAVHHYTRCLAFQLRPYDISVNVVAPGPIITPRFVASRETDESMKVTEGTKDRYGWPIEIARAVEFLATEASSYITGQVLRVDGGRQLWPG